MAPEVPVQVRPARPDDVGAFLDLREAVADEGLWIGAEAPLDRDRDEERFLAALDDPDMASLAADVDGHVVGHLTAFASAGIVGLGMQIAAGWRGRGIGAALLTAALDWARGHGAHKVMLEVWPHNVAAIRLYRRHGFTVEGRRRRQYRRRSGELWDSIQMGLVLDEESPGSPHPDEL